MKNLFGTDGIRTATGKSPLTMTELIQLGQAIALWAFNTYKCAPTILLAHDTRQSCSFIKAALKTGLLSQGATVHDAHVLPTPAVSTIMHAYDQFQCGIIISASHNPHHDNGIKIVDGKTGKLSESDEYEISRLFLQERFDAHYDALGSDIPFTDAAQTYHTIISQLLTPNFLKDTKIILDCANGATAKLAPAIFTACGAHVITLHTAANGTNINDNCGALHPQDLQRAVIEHGAYAGFAFDGDGDRVIAVNSRGEIKNGDDMLVLLLEHPRYSASPALVGTVMTNQGLHALLEQKHKTLIRTPVGDKHVAQALVQERLLLGGEQSGHVIMRDYINTGDGIMTALRVLESMLLSGNHTMHTFERYPQVLINIPVTHKHDLASEPYASIIRASEAQLISGRVLVRYSGTEPLLRVMIEDKHEDHAYTIGNTLAQALQKELALPRSYDDAEQTTVLRG